MNQYYNNKRHGVWTYRFGRNHQYGYNMLYHNGTPIKYYERITVNTNMKLYSL